MPGVMLMPKTRPKLQLKSAAELYLVGADRTQVPIEAGNTAGSAVQSTNTMTSRCHKPKLVISLIIFILFIRTFELPIF